MSSVYVNFIVITLLIVLYYYDMKKNLTQLVQCSIPHERFSLPYHKEQLQTRLHDYSYDHHCYQLLLLIYYLLLCH